VDIGQTIEEIIVGIIVAIVIAIVAWVYKRIFKWKLEFRGIKYKKDRLLIQIKNRGKELQDVYFEVETENEFLQVRPWFEYTFESRNKTTIISFFHYLWKPGITRNISIRAEKKKSGETEIRIIVIHGKDRKRYRKKLVL